MSLEPLAPHRRWAKISHAAWAALNVAAALTLVLVPQHGHPPPIVLLPLLALVWPLGHCVIWLISWLTAVGQRHALATSRRWPITVIFGLLGTGVASLLGIVQALGSGVQGRWYPYPDPALWVTMLVVWVLHGMCFVALLVRQPWSRYLAALLALGWALLLGRQLAEGLMSSTRGSTADLLFAAALLVLLLVLAAAFVSSAAVKSHLRAGNTGQPLARAAPLRQVPPRAAQLECQASRAMQYIPDNLREYESAARDVPDCLQEVQRLLDGRWKLAAFQRYRISGNWIAGLEMGDRHFRLVCDRGYVDVFEITGGRETQILPPKEQRTSILPREICELLARAVA